MEKDTDTDAETNLLVFLVKALQWNESVVVILLFYFEPWTAAVANLLANVIAITVPLINAFPISFKMPLNMRVYL